MSYREDYPEREGWEQPPQGYRVGPGHRLEYRGPGRPGREAMERGPAMPGQRRGAAGQESWGTQPYYGGWDQYSGYPYPGFGQSPGDPDTELMVGRGFQSGLPQGPHVGKGPRNYQPSDDRILDEVCSRLTQHGRIDASDIQVNVRNGEVELTGTVHSRDEKRMAEDVAESVAGVRFVDNDLRVQPEVGR